MLPSPWLSLRIALQGKATFLTRLFLKVGFSKKVLNCFRPALPLPCGHTGELMPVGSRCMAASWQPPRCWGFHLPAQWCSSIHGRACSMRAGILTLLLAALTWRSPQQPCGARLCTRTFGKVIWRISCPVLVPSCCNTSSKWWIEMGRHSLWPNVIQTVKLQQKQQRNVPLHNYSWKYFRHLVVWSNINKKRKCT